MKDKTPEVSVVLSVYNEENYVQESIQSILQQTWQDFELILINDGSTDRTLEIINSFDDPRINLLNNSRNMDVIFSVNRGLKESRGKWIFRTDGDDWNAPERIEKQLEWAEENNLDICFSDWKLLKYSGEEFDIQDSKRSAFTKNWQGLFYNAYGANPTVCFRREKIMALGGYHENSVVEDYDMWDRCVVAGLRFGCVPEILVRHRKHPGSFTSTRWPKLFLAGEKISNRALRRVWPELDDETLSCLRWILGGGYTETSEKSQAAGFRICKEFIARYLQQQKATRVQSAEIWAEVATSLQWRIRKVQGWADRFHVLMFFFEAAIRASGRWRPPVRTAIRWLISRLFSKKED